MPMSIEQLLNMFIFMKASVIHNNNAFTFKTWYERVFAPIVEYAAIDVLLKVIQCK